MRTITATHVAFLFSLMFHLVALVFSRGLSDVRQHPVERFEVSFLQPTESTAKKTVSPSASMKTLTEKKVLPAAAGEPYTLIQKVQQTEELPFTTQVPEKNTPQAGASSSSRGQLPVTAENRRGASIPSAPVSREIMGLKDAAERASEVRVTNRLADYLSVIKATIENNKEYPAFAKQLGLQGTVVVRASILSNGTLQEVFIIASAGHKSLDKSAIATVRTSGPFKPPVIFGLSEVTVDIPITYKIN